MCFSDKQEIKPLPLQKSVDGIRLQLLEDLSIRLH